jgi:hypothetical protein
MDPLQLAPFVVIGILLIAIWRELRVANRPRRTKAEFSVLPLSTGVKIATGSSASITARVNNAFRPDRLFVSNAGEGAHAWVINDIKVGGRSVFAQSGDIPADMFATSSIDNFVKFPVVLPSQSVEVVVTNTGKTEQPFYASICGAQLKKSRAAKKVVAELSASSN